MSTSAHLDLRISVPAIGPSDIDIGYLSFDPDKIAYPCSDNKLFYCFRADEIIEKSLDMDASYVRKTKDGGRVVVRLWRKRDGVYQIARGFAPILTKYKYTILPFAEWIDPVTPTHVGTIKLRDYQSEVIYEALTQMRLIGSATLYVATGGGKTYILLSIYDQLKQLKPGLRAVWLTLSKDLILQAGQMAHKAGIRYGIVYGDEFTPNASLTGITVQSAYYAITGKHLTLIDYPTKREIVKRRDIIISLIKNADLIIFDESQHIPAKSVLEVIKANPNALVVSASGTPKRNDSDTPLIYAISGPIVPRIVTSSELIQLGYLVKPYIYMLKMTSGCTAKGRGVKKYMEVRRCVELHPNRAFAIANIVSALYSMGLTPIMVHVNLKKSCKLIANSIKHQGIPAICVSSEINERIRNAIFNGVREGKIGVIVVTPLGREGLDLPNIKILIMASGGKSVVSVPQTIGRVLRSSPGKKVAIVIDVDDRDEMLKFHGLSRYRLYAQEPMWHVERVDDISELIKKITELVVWLDQSGA